MGRGKHCTVEERRIALTLRNKGKSLRFIAETLNRSLYFVQNALKKQPSVEHRGRPKKTSLTTDNRIITMAKRDPFISSRAISAEIGNIVSSRTVRRRLYSANLPGRIARKIPLLRQKNLKARQTFARFHSNWSGPEGEKSGAMSYGPTKLKLICSAMTRLGT